MERTADHSAWARAVTRVLLVLLCTAGAALAEPPGERARPTEFGDDLLVHRLSSGVWLHVTRSTNDHGRVPASGLLVTTGELSILVDAGWTESQTERLIQWADESLGQPVGHLIVTHAHADRMGGIAAAMKRPIEIHGHAATAAIANRSGAPVLDWTFEFEERLELAGEPVHLYYPGPGHTVDNIVVWLPRRRVVFAGCLVKASDAESLGYIGDADLEHWPVAVGRLISRYRDARFVVPGHGRPGGVELFSHTMELLEAATGSARLPRRYTPEIEPQ